MTAKGINQGVIGCVGALCFTVGMVGLIVLAFVYLSAVRAEANAITQGHIAKVDVAKEETAKAAIVWAAKVRIEEIQAESNAARYATTSTAQKLTVFGLLTALAMILSYMKSHNGIESDSGLISIVKDVADRMRGEL